MKVLFIGGTGNISDVVSQQAIAGGWTRIDSIGLAGAELIGCHQLTADIHKPDELGAALKGLNFDVVVNWIAFSPADIERDLHLFNNRIQQYIFISSASAYQKPPDRYLITESTPLSNPYWEYSRNKIACEERLLQARHDEGFRLLLCGPRLPITIAFPWRSAECGSYTVPDRMKRGYQ
jgi:nucleoside-diphosphate-sugar epimerase